LNSDRVARMGVGALLALYLLVGAVWTASNLATVPPYGDTQNYLLHMRDLEVDAYRGFAYPLLLAGTAKITGSRDRVVEFKWNNAIAKTSGPPPTPAGLTAVEIFQLVASFCAIAYFMLVVVSPASRPLSTRKFVLLLALLFFDPLVAHFNLSVMTDGLALAASLAFVAALTDAVVNQRHPRLGLVVLATSSFLLVGLRPEKRYVVLATVLTAAIVCHFWARPQMRRASWLACGVALAAIVASLGVQSYFEKPSRRPSVWTTIVHQRIAYPHLGELYPLLPEQWKSRLTGEMVSRYDSHVNRARTVVNQMVAGDDELRDLFTQDLARLALRHKGLAITLDIGKDSLENFLATASFYGRLAFRRLAGEGEFEARFQADGSHWTYTRLAAHSPLLSCLYVGLAAANLVAIVALIIASRQRFSIRRGERASVVATPNAAVWQATLSRWLPVIAFSAFNGIAFAATADLVHIRYVLIAHVAFLTAIYSHAIDLILPDRAA
jgi:hypothetical protein